MAAEGVLAAWLLRRLETFGGESSGKKFSRKARRLPTGSLLREKLNWRVLVDLHLCTLADLGALADLRTLANLGALADHLRGFRSNRGAGTGNVGFLGGLKGAN